MTDPLVDKLRFTRSGQSDLLLKGKSVGQSFDFAMRRNTYYYWHQIGEIQAIRQMVGHKDLPEYAGDIGIEAPCCPEQGFS